MNRFVFSFVALLFIVSCGSGDNNFIDSAEPEFTIDGSAFIQLRMPTDEDKNRTQEALMVRNSGDGAMTVTAIEWIDRPDRLVALTGRSEATCDDGATCDGATTLDGSALNDPVCLTTTNSCNGTGFPAAPFDIDKQLRQDFEFLITQGSRELTCPEPTIELPGDINPEEYCGSVRIATNAKTDSSDGLIVEGVATIFFLAPTESSGIINITPDSHTFEGVVAGSTHEFNLQVNNDGDKALQVNNFAVDQNRTWFNFEGQEDAVPTSIEPGTGKTWRVVLNVPAEATEEEIEFTTVIDVETSAGNASQGKIFVEVTAGTGDAPSIEISATTLQFDAQAMQTLTITNAGTATLLVSGVSIRPPTNNVFYTMTNQGAAVNNLTIPQGMSEDIVIAFERPVGNTNASSAILEINHNDNNNGQISEVVLLGDDGNVPFGLIAPDSFTFFAQDGNDETRDFVIRNLGVAPLNITNVMWNFSVGSNAEFLVNNAQGQIAPGDFKRVSVSFNGGNSTADSGLAIFESNNAGPLELAIRALDSASELPVPAITPTFSGNAPVGFGSLFEANESTPASALSSARWVLLARPAGSTAWLSKVGSSATVVPDVAGAYTLGLYLNGGDREAQTTFDFTAE